MQAETERCGFSQGMSRVTGSFQEGEEASADSPRVQRGQD